MLVRIIIGLFAISVSAGALAAPCAGFVDVDSASSFCPNVTWIKSRGITLGCTDASHYCPNDPVTRLQMAAFMYRLGFQNALLAGGNAFGSTAVLGTTDNNAVEIKVNGSRVMRYEPTTTTASPNVIGGSPNNSADPFPGQTIAGGGKAGINCYDPVTVTYSRICGNQVAQGFATVGGGVANIASGDVATVGGGRSNTAGLVGFQSYGPTVGGGDYNTASGDFAAIGGGIGNTASGSGATVGGGEYNAAGGVSATVPGGENNIASGSSSFAAGDRAKALHNYAFVWGGDPFTDTYSQQAGDFVVYAPAPGAIRMYAGAIGAGGCILPDGTTGWQCTSDRNLKENFVELDGRDILHRLSSIPITRWNAKAVPNVQHIGPMAQDFYAAFGLGTDNLSIGTTDAQGVALAAIQAVYAELKERDATIAEQQHEIAELRERMAQVESLRGELAALRNAIAGAVSGTPIATRGD